MARGIARVAGVFPFFADCQPRHHNTKGIDMLDFGYGGLVGLLILAGDIWALLNIFQSSASNEKKLLWILVVLILPLLGLILWYFLGPRGKA
jgi:hypothetical protein